MDDLFLLAPGFVDANLPGRTFVCPHCTLLEGLLALYPDLARQISVHRVPFARPRQAVIDLVGEQNQSLPALVLAEGKASPFKTGAARGREFISDSKAIAAELRRQYGVPELHP
jgi:hypothetical protein